jgi:uncharacterized repeat protein (TIGR02543 family)
MSQNNTSNDSNYGKKNFIVAIIGIAIATIIGVLSILIMSGMVEFPTSTFNEGTVTLTFMSEGNIVETRIIGYGTAPGPLPFAPRREGYFFRGWFMDNAFTRSIGNTTNIYTDNIIYAGWSLIEAESISSETVIVSFDSNGGATRGAMSVVVGSPYGVLGIPVKAGYRFEGWYNVAGEHVTSNSIVTTSDNHTLTARFSPREIGTEVIVIYLSMHNGSELGTKTVVVGEQYGTLATPIRDGYIFDGWETVAGVNTTSSCYVLHGSDHYLVARWQPE